MPEMHFEIQWPDGSQETCYSPSLVIKDYFTPQQTYKLADFVTRSHTALTIASDRVKAKYGMPCSLALAQLKKIELQAAKYQKSADSDNSEVQILRFIE